MTLSRVPWHSSVKNPKPIGLFIQNVLAWISTLRICTVNLNLTFAAETAGVLRWIAFVIGTYCVDDVNTEL